MSHRTNPGCCFGHVYSGCRLWGPVLTNQCNGRGVHLFMSVSLFVSLFVSVKYPLFSHTYSVILCTLHVILPSTLMYFGSSHGSLW